MSLLQPPKSHYSSFYEQEKFKLTWKLVLLVTFGVTFLTIYHLIVWHPYAITSVIATVMAISILLVLYWKRTYKQAALIGFVLGSVILQTDLFLIPSASLLVDLSYIITIGMYIFYVLGNRAGLAFYFINFTGVCIVLVHHMLEDQGQLILTSSMVDVLVNLSINVLLSIYIITKILRSSRIAEMSYHQANKLLMEQNEIVNLQNEEKTVLLKEIHHRVKNNLQVITSLLRLQSKELKDAETITHFREATNRVMAMALIHDKLYQSKDLSKIDMQSYLRSLSDDLIASYSVEIPVSVNIDTDIEHMVPRSLVSVALLFNELISNSLKHGIQGLDEGQIDISIKQHGDESIDMSYKDNGTWKAPTKESSFGTDLIETLTSQLDGTYELKTEGGTEYNFKFTINE